MPAEQYADPVKCHNCKHPVEVHGFADGRLLSSSCEVKGCPCPRFDDPRKDARTLDEMMGEFDKAIAEPLRQVGGVITKDGSIELTEAMETLTGDTASAFTEYRAATVGLRDAELALKAAQERYRNALGGLNNAIAKVSG